MTMDKYTILCSQEQTRNAIKLGAPIREAMSRYNARLAYERIQNNKETREEYNKQGIAILDKRAYNIPTAEQMIGWLEEQGLGIGVAPYVKNKCWCFYINSEFYVPDNFSRKEATLAAIDVALKYLNDNKK